MNFYFGKVIAICYVRCDSDWYIALQINAFTSDFKIHGSSANAYLERSYQRKRVFVSFSNWT